MLAPWDTTIHRLHLRGPAASQNRISRELQQAQWPQAGSEQYVFVRRVQASAEPHRLTDTLLQEARHCIEHDTNPDNVVRFPNLQAVLASLLTDLALGHAAQRWYWKRWNALFNRAPGNAIASLMADNLAHLNGVISLLAQRQMLKTVWQTLQPEDATKLIQELNWQQGYRIPAGSDTGTDTATTISALSNARAITTLPLPGTIVQRWQNAIGDLPATDQRLRLACVLAAQEWVPLMLWQAPEVALATVAAHIVPGSAALSSAKPSEKTSALSSEKSSAKSSAVPPPFVPPPFVPPPFVPPPLLQSTTTPVDNNSDTSTDHPQGTQQASTHQHQTEQAKQAPANSPNPSEKAAGKRSDAHPLQQVRLQPEARNQPSPLPEGQFQTQQGGVLYLLNFLNRSELQSLMGDHWETLPNGWLWLYRVAQLLEFDESDPLAGYIAQQLGWKPEDSQLPDLPEADRIRQLAQQWYGQQGLSQDKLWQPNLLCLPATICHDASHIDLYTSPDNVRIDVRLAGLDINPGWLPWLGRVVTFHYEQPA